MLVRIATRAALQIFRRSPPLPPRTDSRGGLRFLGVALPFRPKPDRRGLLGAGLLLLAPWSAPFAPKVVAQGPETSPTATERLHRLFEAEWDYEMKESPTVASALGDRRFNDRWPDVSLAAIERRHRHHGHVLDELSRIDRSQLTAADRLNAKLFERRYEERIAEHPFQGFLLPFDHRGGVQTAHELTESLRFDRVQDYKDWIRRLRKLGRYVDQHLELMRKGLEAGVTHPRVILERVRRQVTHQLVDDAAASPFYEPFIEMPGTIDETVKHRLRTAAKLAIGETVIPAYRRFLDFFDRRYLPAARASVGASALPRGNEWYTLLVRRFTTLDLSAKEIHAIGLKEVERIRGEMEAIVRELSFEGSLQEFIHFLRTDARFYFESADELLKEYRDTAKRIDPELVHLFHRLPRMPYGVKPIPEEIAPDTTTAYYSRPAADGSRAGTFYVNLFRPEVRPTYEIEALTAHEAVPGHHLQIALAMELGELPKFRRFGGYTAFVEGWGLYAESLGAELGLYRDPYSRFGQLTYEMWRAIRLVVDTGIHVLGWDRARAIEFFAENAAKSQHDIVNEIDRYIAWPGQALAYKLGELKLKELRQRAREALGSRFDVRRFHHVVLRQGAVPLDLLEENVEAYIGSSVAQRPEPEMNDDE